MIISFDIDNTLIPYSDEFEVERRTVLAKLTGAESLRAGTISLFKSIESRGDNIWIYTTSFRSKLSLRRTFMAYGLNPTRIINQTVNQSVLKSNNCSASKNPKMFGINVHVDDSEGVSIEGQQLGFEVILVNTSDADWTNKILCEIEIIRNKRVINKL